MKPPGSSRSPDREGLYLASIVHLDPSWSAEEILRRRREFLGRVRPIPSSRESPAPAVQMQRRAEARAQEWLSSAPAVPAEQPSERRPGRTSRRRTRPEEKESGLSGFWWAILSIIVLIRLIRLLSGS